MSSHVFITKKYLDRCLQTGLFGVTHPQINYLANVRREDTAFFLETGSGRLVGPFTVQAPLFFSDDPIWEASKDPFVNRVQLTTNHQVWEADITALWDVLLQRDSGDFLAFTTFQRSAVTLLPGEGQRLAKILASSGNESSSLPPFTIKRHPVDLLMRDSQTFSSEARLESCFLLARECLLDMLYREELIDSTDDAIIMNQVTLPGNYDVDIVVFVQGEMVIIELKKDSIKKATIRQILRYGTYWKHSERDCRLLAIGSEIRARDKERKVGLLTYRIDRDSKTIIVTGNRGGYEFPTQFSP